MFDAARLWSKHANNIDSLRMYRQLDSFSEMPLHVVTHFFFVHAQKAIMTTASCALMHQLGMRIDVSLPTSKYVQEIL